MTPIKTLGISIFVAVLLLLVSCNTLTHIQKGATVLEETSKYYINDSLSFSYQMGGDYNQIIPKKEIRKHLKKIDKSLHLKNNIACFKTYIKPDLIHFIFYFKKEKRQNNNLFNVIKNDTNDFYLDTGKSVVGKYFKLENDNGSIYIIGKLLEKNGYLPNLTNEYDDIFESVVTNEKYRDINFYYHPFYIPGKREFSEDSAVNYLMPVYLLKKYEANYTNVNDRFMWLQVYGTYISRFTNEEKNIENTINEYRNITRANDRNISSESALRINNDALSELLQKCKNERIVMMNENHFANYHRLLGEMLLDSLYTYGFRYFGMEAIGENDTVLNERGFATTHTGFYTREPIMANLIRSAIKKGFYVFGYDDVSGDRERDQALNIQRNVFDKDSLAKVFIWAGFGHINETENVGKTWMAREFLSLTGINPLTIEQTEFQAECSDYLMLLDTTKIKKTKMLCDFFITNNINYNFFVERNGSKNYEISIPSDIAKQAKKEPLMYIVSVFIANEYLKDSKAIPVYNYLLNDDVQQISIKLPSNNQYLYTIKDRDGKILIKDELLK